MTLTSLLATASAAGVPWLAIADAVGKASILLGAAGLTSLALRRGSASARHLVWTLALAGALIIPALSLALPRWQLPVVEIATVTPTAASVATSAATETEAQAPALIQARAAQHGPHFRDDNCCDRVEPDFLSAGCAGRRWHCGCGQPAAP